MTASDTPGIDLPVYITGHAIERARERHPDFFRRRGVAGIYAEVSTALLEGRRAKTMPRWALVDGTRRRKTLKRYGTGLFVWNTDETRCYALRRGTTHKGPGWVVKTVIARETVEEAA